MYFVFVFFLLSFVFCLLYFFHQDHHCGSESSSPRIVSGAEAGLHDALPVTKHVKLRQRHVWRHLNTSQVLSFCLFFLHIFTSNCGNHMSGDISTRPNARSVLSTFVSFFFKSHIFPLKKTQFEIHRFRQVTVENIFSFCL